MNEAFDQLELELRRLPGVTGIGFSTDADSLVIHVMAAPAGGDREDLRRQVAQQARALVSRPMAIEIEFEEHTAPVGERVARPGRVQLLEVEVEDHTLDVVVRLAHGGRRAVGRGGAGSPVDAAQATMRALAALGAEVPFKVEASAAPVGPEDQAVVVMFHPEQDEDQRYGVARGSTLEEAACRATLHALNRWLARHEAFAATG